MYRLPTRWICLSLLLVAGCSARSFLVTPVGAPQELQEIELKPAESFNAGKVVIIDIEGMLINAKEGGGLLGASENPLSSFQQQIDRIMDDDSIRAIVLRVNSPGGTVSSSDAMYTILNRVKAKRHIPIVASTSEVCASGAYYVSCAADKIVVQPTSVVGSIGVIFDAFDVSGTMAKIGVKSEPIKSGPNKDMGSPFKPLGDPEKQIMQGMVNEYYDRFKAVVTTNRHIADDKKEIAFDGRVFSGQKAVEIGLADQTGLLDDAIELAKTMGNCPHAKVITFKRAYAYSGSIYAGSSNPQPRMNVLQLELPGEHSILPSGFYYMWQP